MKIFLYRNNMSELTKQSLHNLGMNIVGKELKKNKFEFLAVNSDLKKNPQFIVKSPNGDLAFIIVKTVAFPDEPSNYNNIWMETFKEHAKSKEAKLFFAGVGLANIDDMEQPLNLESGYIVKYKGLKEI